MLLKFIETIPHRDIRPNGADAGLFKDLNGIAHATMQADWDKGGIMTACNGWTGHYSTKLGRPELGCRRTAQRARNTATSFA